MLAALSRFAALAATSSLFASSATASGYGVDFTIPTSSQTVSVKMIQSINLNTIPASLFFAPQPDVPTGNPVDINGWAFLLEHKHSGRRVLFDMGMRADSENLSPGARAFLNGSVLQIDKDVPTQLVERNVTLDTIEAVILSHTHFDHIGDQTKMPNSTNLVLGPGSQAHIRPAYPINPNSNNLESDFTGRDVQEVVFDGPKISGFKTHDYFGDGSFYLIDTPGHIVGHMSGLVRVTAGAHPSFILLAGDAAHHAALIRPNRDEPLPLALLASIPPALNASACPDFGDPLVFSAPANASVHEDAVTALNTLEKLRRFDAREDIWVVVAHDISLVASVDQSGRNGFPLFPEAVNNWRAKGWKDMVRWNYLKKGNAANAWDNATEAIAA